MRLEPASRGRIFAHSINLEKGSARIGGFSANVDGLQVRADGAASAVVSMRDKGTVEVASLTGDVHVLNSVGVMLANMQPGMVLDFLPQGAGPGPQFTLTGCAEKRGSNLMVADEKANVIVQLRGASVRANRHVELTGSMVPASTPVSPATQVFNVTSVKDISGPCKTTIAGLRGAGAGGAAAAGAAGGGGGAAAGAISTTTWVLIGVGAAAAAGAGIAVASSGGKSSTQVSSGRLGAFN